MARAIDRFRERLSYHDALPQLTVLGLVSGLAAALLIVAFRWLIETPLTVAFSGNVDGFESLPTRLRFGLPLGGALLLGVALTFLDPRHREVSVSHVLDRLHNYQGKIPGSNIIVQFLGGIVALISGQSVGREGPSVHLGAGVASLLGQYFRLPNNSLRTLVACGSAAAIAASFNTPMAGVVFAMEVVLMEYTIAGFVPVILASVLGATISQLVFGNDLSFVAMEAQPEIISELPFLVFSGAVFAVAAALFIKVHLVCMRQQHRPVLLRFLIIGLLTGTVAIYLPQVLGTGYDTLNQAMTERIDVQLLAAILLAKLLVTAIVTGLGMLGGLIGPTLMIGGCLGALLGLLGNYLMPGSSPPEFYVSLGMVAMMGAVLNAPLAALVAILELSHSPGIIFPAMLLVVVSCLGVQVVFSYRGIFAEQLRLRGLDVFAEPGKGFLSRVGVRSVMNRSFRVSDSELDRTQAQNLVDSEAIWLVVETDDGYRLLAMADLARYLAASEVKKQDEPGPDQDAAPATGPDKSAESGTIDLTAIPGTQLDIAVLDSLASLHDASRQLRETGAEAVLVIESISYDEARVIGILNRATVSAYYGM